MSKMCRKILSLIVILFPLFASTSYSFFFIELKNGSEFIVEQYWESNRYIRFYYTSGMVSVPQDAVRTIRESDLPYHAEEIDYEKISQSSEDQIIKSPGKPRDGIPPKSNEQDIRDKNEPIDLDAYIKKNAQLKAHLNTSLEKLKDATRNKDSKEKENARKEARRISGQIYDLSEELKRKNKGVLPPGWWDTTEVIPE